MDLSKPISQLEKDVYDLQNKLRKLQEKGIPIYDRDNMGNYSSQSNTYDLIERWFNKL